MSNYNIEYSEESRQDLIDIKQYIKYNLQEPTTAQKLISKIENEINIILIGIACHAIPYN